jgi:hypothetical protein
MSVLRDQATTLEAQARALAERAARTMECSGNDAHTVFATGETAAIILSALQDAEARARQQELAAATAIVSDLRHVLRGAEYAGTIRDNALNEAMTALRARATETAK